MKRPRNDQAANKPRLARSRRRVIKGGKHGRRQKAARAAGAAAGTVHEVALLLCQELEAVFFPVTRGTRQELAALRRRFEEKLMSAMREDYATVLRRVDFQGEEVAWVAADLGLEEKVVATRLRLARLALHALLGQCLRGGKAERCVTLKAALEPPPNVH
ncbi:MAG: hypothetical protein ACOY99_08305 [Pseudomonadota bacterium]